MVLGFDLAKNKILPKIQLNQNLSEIQYDVV